MAEPADTFGAWLTQAQLPEARLSPQQLALLQAVFAFRLRQGADYYSTRLLGHFLLHCDAGLKVAVIARLLGLSRPTASRQQGLSSKEAIRQAHHRMDGRPYGKLLPRYTGPIAQFLCTHPEASRADLVDFIDTTFGVHVSRVALARFLKKYGLDRVTLQSTAAVPTPAPLPVPASAQPRPAPEPPQRPPLPAAAPPFSAHARSTRGPSC